MSVLDGFCNNIYHLQDEHMHVSFRALYKEIIVE